MTWAANIEYQRARLGLPPDPANNGGMSVTGNAYFVELNAATSIPISLNTMIEWDTIYGTADGYAQYDGTIPSPALALPPGVYLTDFEVDISTPVASRLLDLRVFVIDGDGNNHNSFGAGQTYVPATAGGGVVMASGLLLVPAGCTVQCRFRALPADTSESSPPAVTTSYAYALFRKVG